MKQFLLSIEIKYKNIKHTENLNRLLKYHFFFSSLLDLYFKGTFTFKGKV